MISSQQSTSDWKYSEPRKQTMGHYCDFSPMAAQLYKGKAMTDIVLRSTAKMTTQAILQQAD